MSKRVLFHYAAYRPNSSTILKELVIK